MYFTGTIPEGEGMRDGGVGIAGGCDAWCRLWVVSVCKTSHHERWGSGVLLDIAIHEFFVEVRSCEIVDEGRGGMGVGRGGGLVFEDDIVVPAVVDGEVGGGVGGRGGCGRVESVVEVEEWIGMCEFVVARDTAGSVGLTVEGGVLSGSFGFDLLQLEQQRMLLVGRAWGVGRLVITLGRAVRMRLFRC